MPDLGNLLNPCSHNIPQQQQQSPNSKPLPDRCEEPTSPINSDSIRALTLSSDDSFRTSWDERLRHPVQRPPDVSNGGEIRVSKKKAPAGKILDICAKEWVASKVQTGVSQDKCCLPFLDGAPKSVISFTYWSIQFSVCLILYLVDVLLYV